MAYRRGNYDFVIDSSFQPFSMQEMLVPYMAYKEAFEESERAYTELSNKADTFAYLSKEFPENSKARQIYEGYANELHKQAVDLASNGLNMSNRGALTGLKRRYQGEIGRLVEADTNLKQAQALRKQMSAKDPSMLYRTDNLNIDMFLDNNTPNLYGISGNELYTKGAAAGRAASSRIYSNPEVRKLDKYYNEYFSTVGYSPEKMQEFRENLAAIPELQQAAMDIASANRIGELGEGSANYQAALQQIVNGIADGAIYQRQSNMQRNPGAPSWAEEAADSRARAAHALQERQFNEVTKPTFEMQKQEWEDQRRLKYNFDENGNVVSINTENIPKNYEYDPYTGKLKKESSSQTPEEKKATEEAKQKGTAMMKLENKDLAHNDGFDVTFGDNRHHYNYIGAISRHGNKWHTGAIGDDNPGHNFPFAWGWASTSNVENPWGSFSAESVDSPAKMRVLSSDDFMKLVSSDPEILKAIEERCEAAGIDPTTADIQIVEVPNEKGGGGQKGYLIAVH